MKATTRTKPAKPAYVHDKHLAALPKPARHEIGPILTAWDEIREWDKIERCFNSAADKGWQMVSFGPFWRGFAPCVPGEYVYRVVTLERPYYHPSSQEYLRFLEDSGAEIVHVFSGGAILRRPALDGPFEVTSTASSKLAHLRILTNKAVIFLWLAYLCCALWMIVPLINLWIPRPPDPMRALTATLGFLTSIVLALGAHLRLRRVDKRFRALITENAVHE